MAGFVQHPPFSPLIAHASRNAWNFAAEAICARAHVESDQRSRFRTHRQEGRGFATAQGGGMSGALALQQQQLQLQAGAQRGPVEMHRIILRR